MNYLRKISIRDQDWADVGKRTVYIEPRRLTATDWDIIECGRSFDTIYDLARAMPMDIGGWRRKPRDTIYKWAQTQTRTYTHAAHGGHDFVRQAACQYGDDVELMRSALWEGISYDSNGEIGHFTKQRIGYVHADQAALGIVFITRVGEAPFDVVPAGLILTEDQERLLQDAEKRSLPPNPTALFPNAVRELRDQKILQPADLDRVIMLFTCPSGWYGTKHVSGPLPPKGAHSAFLRAFTHFSLT